MSALEKLAEFGRRLDHGKGRSLAVVVLIAAATWVVVIHARVAVLPFDDAFITYRYADNIATGRGPVYNSGERVFGSSTPLYLFWLTPLRLLSSHASLPEVAVRWNAIWLVLAGVAAFLLARRLTGSSLLAALAATCIMLNRSMLVISTGGMESFLFVSLVLLALWALSTRRSWSFGGLAGLALLTRPEGAVLVPLALFGFWRQWRPLARALAAWMLVVGMWVVTATAYYGSPVPHSVVAKMQPIYPLPAGIAVDLVRVGVTGFLSDVWHQSGRDLASLATWGLLLVAAGASVARGTSRRVAGWGPAAFLIGVMVLYLWGNPMIFPWYWPHLFVPALLTLMVGLPLAGDWAQKALSARNSRAARVSMPVAVTLTVAVSLTSLVSPYLRGPGGLQSVLTDVSESPERLRVLAYREVASELNELAAADDRLAASEIGALGFYFSGEILDGCGLVTPAAIPFLPVAGSDRDHQANGAIALEFVQATAPEWVVTLPVFARQSLLDSEWFQSQFLLAGRLPLPKEIWSSQEVLVFRSVDGLENRNEID